jgi:thiamine kinase-like enzyme
MKLPGFASADYIAKVGLLHSYQGRAVVANSQFIFSTRVIIYINTMSAVTTENHRTLPIKIDLNQDETALNEDIKTLVGEMLSLEQTEMDALSISTVTGGITNRLYLVENALRPEMNVIVRFFGEGTHEFIDRNAENMVFSALSDHEFGPKFEGLFENGRVEGYLNARCLIPEEMANPEIYRVVANLVHRLHSIHLPAFFLYQRGWGSDPSTALSQSAEKTHANHADPWIWKKIHLFFTMARVIIKQLEQSATDSDVQKVEQYRALNLEVIIQQSDWLQHIIEKILAQLSHHMHYHDHIHGLKAPDGIHDRVSMRDKGMAYSLEEVLCHNDLLSGNLLMMKSLTAEGTQQVDVRLIDYEYASYNYRCYDLANHFCGKSCHFCCCCLFNN